MEHPELDSPFEGKYLYRKKYHIHIHTLLLFWQPTFDSNMSSYVFFSIAFILQAFKHRPSRATIIRDKFISTNRKFQSPQQKSFIVRHKLLSFEPSKSIRVFSSFSPSFLLYFTKIGCLRFNELSSPSYVSYY